MPIGRTEPVALSLPFQKFWSWLHAHANCIMRAGTPEVILFDHDDYHWHLADEDSSVALVQLVRGKELVAEMVVLVNEIAYVQCEAVESGQSGEGEFLFECVVEGEASREVACHFVLAHGYDEAGPPARRGWTH